MKIVFDYPPNIEEIQKTFDIKGRNTIVFTYGDTIYNPGKGHISEDLMIHESTHSKQQGDDPGGWWMRYLEDRLFRLEQEAEAYQLQYNAFILRYKDRNKRAVFLHKISCDLSSRIYGNIIGYEKAKKLILEGGVINL